MKPLFSKPFADEHTADIAPNARRVARHRKTKHRKSAHLRHESLEQRAMMAITTAGGGPISNYLVVASDDASDVYIQRHAGDRFLIADNSSFLENSNFFETGTTDILYVTNGARGNSPSNMLPGDNTPGNAGTNLGLASRTRFFLNSDTVLRPRYDLDSNGVVIRQPAPIPTDPLPHEEFQTSNSIRGTVSFDGATWDFGVREDGTVKFRLQGTGNQTPSAQPKPVGSIFNTNGRAFLDVEWTSSVSTIPHPAVPNVPAPPAMDSISFFTGAAADPRLSGDSQVPPSSSESSFFFQVPSSVYAPGTLRGIIPGTLTGSAVVDGLTVNFGTDFLGGGTLYFNGQTSFAVSRFVTVSGTWSIAGDIVTIGLGFSSPPRGAASIGGVGYIAYVEDPNPNSFTLFAGHDLTSQLQVDLLTPNSTVNVDSRIAAPTTLRDPDSNVEDIVLRATNVNINAEVASTDHFRVGPSVVGAAIAETLLVNAAIAAPQSFVLDISDDPATDPLNSAAFVGPTRGLIGLSPSGSLSGSISATSSTVSTPTSLVLVRAIQSDIVTEGIIFGTNQTYLMNSESKASGNAPFSFSTRSQATGVDTGLIRGDTVSITLGNDVPTPLDQSIAYNTLDLNTQIQSLRVRAGTQQQAATGQAPPNPSDSGPFPYNLSIRETDDISFDAVAGSGLPISLEAGGNIRFTSALATASDVTIRSISSTDNSTDPPTVTPAILTITAPIVTTKGQIRLEADSVALNNAVRVTDSMSDPYRDDIWITANSGDILLRGLVSAKNRVRLEQSGPTVATSVDYAASRTPVDIPDNGTAVKTVQVSDDFVFDDLNVVVDITHPFVRDLVLTLISPDNRRFTLASQLGASGDNFTSTIFDSEAVDRFGQPLPIAAGSAPFTGRFRPVDSLASLYGGSTLGTWRLEVRDATTRDTGSINGFTLQFGTQAAGTRKIFGPARIQADSLLIDAGGAIGNPSLLPTDTNFFLRTDVNTLSGRTGASAAFDELNDINIESLRAPGFVSLRANGSDRSRYDRSTGEFVSAALKANLIDVTGLDLAAPNGSIDVLFDTSKTIQLGNEAGLRLGKSLNSVAAGNVTIRSTAGSIDVLDAPVAGGNARTVRFKTTASLSAAGNGLSNVTYSPGTPGVFASTIRGNGNLAVWLGTNSLRLGDRILVTEESGRSANRNGVYALTAFTGNSWTLTRAADSDTIAELPSNTFVRVESDSSSVFELAYSPFLLGTLANASSTVTGIESTAGLQPGMLVVGAGIPQGALITSVGVGQITLSRSATSANSNAQLKVVPSIRVSGTTAAGSALVTGLFTTSDLRVGMLVFGPGIADGTIIEAINTSDRTIQISQQASAAGSGDLRFVAPSVTRLGDTANNSSIVAGLSSTEGLEVGMVVFGAGIANDTTLVRIIDGSSVELSQFSQQSAQATEIRFVSLLAPRVGISPMTVRSRSIATDIGSNDPNDLVTFVVSTSGGTNSAAGSLGKMISLRQQNIAKTGTNAIDQSMAFKFSEAVRAPIRLTQELPEITKAFVIDGSAANRYDIPSLKIANQASPLVDGSRITLTRTGRNLVATDTIDGLKIRGANADGTVISNIKIGGFGRRSGTNLSAAINISDADGVRVDRVTVGENELAARLANQVGVLFTNGSIAGTVLNSTILSGIDSGIRVDGGASGVSVVGSTIGRTGLENAVGVRFVTGTNYLGVDPVSPAQSLSPVIARRLNATAFTIPTSNPVVKALYRDLAITGTPVVATDPTLPARVVDWRTNGNTTTIFIAGGNLVGDGLISFGNVAYTKRSEAGWAGTEVKLLNPAAAGLLADLFLGQEVRGDGIAPNSTITKIELVAENGGQPAHLKLTLSRPVLKTGQRVVTFVAGGRNTIQANQTGVVLSGGQTTVTNTSVIGNNFNGIEILGGRHVIGTATAGVPSANTTTRRTLVSNSIHSNGGWAILVRNDSTNSADGDSLMSSQTIQYNYLGGTSAIIDSATLANRRGNIGIRRSRNAAEEVFAGIYAPDARGVDSRDNQHGLPSLRQTNSGPRLPWLPR